MDKAAGKESRRRRQTDRAAHKRREAPSRTTCRAMITAGEARDVLSLPATDVLPAGRLEGSVRLPARAAPLVAAAVALAGTPLPAEPAAVEPMRVASQERSELPLDGLLRRVQERYRGLQDLRARFRQRSVARPGMPAREASGTWFARPPGRLRVEYDATGRVLVADGDVLYWYLPEDRQVQIRDQDALASSQTPMLYLTSDADLGNDFTVAGTEWEEKLAPGNVQLRLDPLTADASYTHLILEVDPDTAMIARLVSFGILGESSEFMFLEVETDLGLAEELFQFTIPANAEVEHLGS